MRIINKIIMFIFFMILVVEPAYAECTPEMRVLYQITAYEQVYPEIESKQQFPNFREDDYLVINALSIYNSDCTYPNFALQIELVDPTDEKRTFCFLNNLSSIPPNENTYLHPEDLINYYDDRYSHKCLIKADKTGEWTVKLDSFVYDVPKDDVVPPSYLLIYNKRKYANTFKVWTKTDLDLITAIKEGITSSANSNLIITVLMIIAILVTIFMAIWQTWWNVMHRKKYEDGVQRDLLKSIETQLRIIEQNIDGQKEEMSKRPPVIPSYFITELDKNFYLTNLRYIINNCETENLKEWIIKVSDKISNINNLINIAHHGSPNKRNETFNEIISNNFKYHKNLQHLIKQLRKELRRIQSFRLKKTKL